MPIRMKESRDTVISFRKAEIVNGESTVIYGLDMDVHKGDFVYIIGKVGSGKTSIIRTITAENRLYDGEGTVCGYNLRSIREKDIPYMRRKMGVVFQDFQLLMDRSVEDNLLFVLKATGWRKKHEIDARINKVLTQVDMQTKGYKMPHELSGGEQQRICIARALLNNPALILADEPTGNLDPETSSQIVQLLHDICGQGTAVIMTTHNYNIVRSFPARVVKCESAALNDVGK